MTHDSPFPVVLKGCKSNRYVLTRLGNLKFAFRVGVEAMVSFKSDLPLGLALWV